MGFLFAKQLITWNIISQTKLFMKKFFIHLHRYIGLIAGLTIFISCFSGAVLSFQNEIRELTYAELYRRPQGEHKSVLPLSELITRVNAQLSEGQIESVQIPSDTTYNYVFTPSSPERTQLYINPYNGNIVGKIDKDTSDIFGFFFRVHRWLLDDSKTWGKQIMGASTLLFVLILISGIVYWWPKSKRELQARLKVKTGASHLRFWRDLHAAGGIYAVTCLLVMALTGLTWSYPWYRAGVYALFGLETPQKKDKKHDKKEGKEQEEPIVFDWDRAYSELQPRATKDLSLSISQGKGTIARKISFGYTRANDEYTLDKTTGVITDYLAYDKKPLEMRVKTWIYIIHTGMWAGVWSKALYLIACLLGASFPLSGLYLYIKQKGQKKPKKSVK